MDNNRDEKGRLKKGHRIWDIYTPYAGVRPEIANATEFYSKSVEYLDWAVEHPWLKNDAVKMGKTAGKIISVPTDRPFSIKGFSVYMGRSDGWYKKMRAAAKKREDADMLDAMRWFENICETQRLEGALIGAFNASLVSAMDGIKQKQDDEANEAVAGEKGKPFTIKIVR